nr:MAG TPA: hypothetical protein [Caudoviricetes sp.]
MTFHDITDIINAKHIKRLAHALIMHIDISYLCGYNK